MRVMVSITEEFQGFRHSHVRYECTWQSDSGEERIDAILEHRFPVKNVFSVAHNTDLCLPHPEGEPSYQEGHRQVRIAGSKAAADGELVRSAFATIEYDAQDRSIVSEKWRCEFLLFFGASSYADVTEVNYTILFPRPHSLWQRVTMKQDLSLPQLGTHFCEEKTPRSPRERLRDTLVGNPRRLIFVERLSPGGVTGPLLVSVRLLPRWPYRLIRWAVSLCVAFSTGLLARWLVERTNLLARWLVEQTK